jgi:hypothetical protein
MDDWFAIMQAAIDDYVGIRRMPPEGNEGGGEVMGIDRIMGSGDSPAPASAWDVRLVTANASTWVARLEAGDFLAADDLARRLLPPPSAGSHYFAAEANPEYDELVARLGGMRPVEVGEETVVAAWDGRSAVGWLMDQRFVRQPDGVGPRPDEDEEDEEDDE